MTFLPSHPALLEHLQMKRQIPEKRDMKAWRQEQFLPYQDSQNTYRDLWNLPDGRILNVLFAGYASKGVIGILQDMTEQLEFDKKYQNSMQNLQETLDNIEESVALFNAEGQLIVYNKALQVFLPFVLQKALHVSYFLSELGKSLKIEPFCQKILTDIGGVFPPEGICGTEKSGDKTLFIRVHQLETGDIFIALKDITPQVGYQALLQDKAEALHELGHVREMFFRRVSFELREPMTVIAGFSEMLQQEIFGTLNPKQHEYMRDIRTCSGQMLRLIDNLIDLVSLEIQADKMAEQFGHHDIHQIVASVIDDIKRQCDEKQILFIATIDPTPYDIFVDYASFRQCLLQIFYNAIAATPKKGRLHFMATPHEQGYQFIIQDTGKGISQDILNNLSKQAGYGLKYIRRVCDLHKIDLQIKIDQGTQMILNINKK